MIKRTWGALIGIALGLALPQAALAQVLIGESSARFDWTPSPGQVAFYEVYVSRSTRNGSYELEQTVSQASVVLDASEPGEVIRVRVRAGNDTEFGPMSVASDTVRFGLPPELPVEGTPGVFNGRSSGADTGFIFYSDRETGDVWRFSVTETGAEPTLLANEPDPSWQLFASGDFDGDGVADLFWRHDFGATRIWFIDGDTYQEEEGPLYPGPAWKCEITGDFDGNGQDDLLWRGANGSIRSWFRIDAEFAATAFPEMPTAIWEVLAAGDYDGDGVDDIFWRDVTTTDTVIWFLAIDPYNGTYARARDSRKRSMLWEIFETGDVNGDGLDDVRWRVKNSHDVAEWWLMDGVNVTPQ